MLKRDNLMMREEDDFEGWGEEAWENHFPYFTYYILIFLFFSFFFLKKNTYI
jgi:hypothetical protein